MSTTKIPLSRLPWHYPAFLSNEAVNPESFPELLLGDTVPDELRDISACSPQRRAQLVEGILSDLGRWSAPETAMAEARKLGEERTYAIVTGQQAGIATGPLYTIYKALGTILLAKRYESAFPGRQFVPVFWIEGDDHDFDEARTVVLPERSGDPRTLLYDDGNETRAHVGDRTVDQEGLGAFLTEAREVLGNTDFSEALFGLIDSAYSGEGTTLTDGFARTIYGLLGDTPLVLVSSRNPVLKRLATEVFALEAAEPGLLYESVKGRSYELAEEGLPTPIEPKLGGLFLTHEGERTSLVPDGDGYLLRGTEIRMTGDETAALARRHPERFSPNVALRPIVQDSILPTAAYVGGPSEIAYLMQLRDAYPMFGLSQPAIAPRPFVTLVEPKVTRALEQSDLQLEQMFDPTFDPATFLIDEKKESELGQATARAEEQLSHAFAMLSDLTNQIDPSLSKSLEAGTHKAGKELENFSGRLRAALKRKNETGINRIEGARTLLLPNGKLQERVVNPMYVANKYGIEKFREVCSSIELAPGSMLAIPL